MNVEGPIESSVRTWRPMILWSGGILLALGLAWFVGAVAVPCWQVRSFVKNAPYKGIRSWEQLGGERRACERLSRYLRWPEWLAPRKDSAMNLLSDCRGGPDALAAILLDEQAPLDIRLPIADYLGQERDNRAALPGDIWLEQALLKALNSSSGRVRVAAARSLLRSWFSMTDQETDAALAQLLSGLKDGDVLVRRDAARALHALAADVESGPLTVANYRVARAVEPALKAALEDPDPAVRAEAAEALKHKMVKKTVKRFGPGE